MSIETPDVTDTPSLTGTDGDADPSDMPSLGSGVRRNRFVVDGLAIAIGAAFAAIVVQPLGSSLTLTGAILWWIAVVVVIRSDLEALIIPDEASIAIAALGLVYTAGTAWLAGFDAGGVLLASAFAVANGLAVFGLFWFVALVFRALRGREGLGFGDTKLAAASAIWLDAGDAAIALEVAALAAVAVLALRRRKGPVKDMAVPFGAFLAPSSWLVFVVARTVHGGAPDFFP